MNTKYAFFLCDIQERFRQIIHLYPAVIQVASRMISASQILDVPLIVTEQYPQALGQTDSDLNLKSIAPARLSVFPKTQFSMLIPEVTAQLQKENIQSVVLFGIETQVCILQTTLDLLKQNYQVFLLVDGISSRHSLDKEVALQRLEKAGATLSTSESFLFQYLRDAKHEKFKSISKLIRDTDPLIYQALNENADHKKSLVAGSL